MFKLDLEKAEEPENKLPTSTGSWKKQGNSRKSSTSASLTMLKPLTMWITTNCGKFWKRWEYQTTWPASWETCKPVKKTVRTGHGTTDCLKIGKGVRQGCILLPCLFNWYAESVQFSHSVVSNSLQPHEPQQARPPCPSPKSQSSPVMPKSRNLPMTTREPVSDAKAREFLLPSLSWGSHRYWHSG